MKREEEGLGEGEERKGEERRQRDVAHSFLALCSLNSVYGRQALIRDTSSIVRSGKSIVTAGANKSEWLRRVKRTEVAGITLGPNGADPTFLLDTRNKFTKFTNVQQASCTLSNSKLTLVRAQALICWLYDTSKLVNCYSDTGESGSLSALVACDNIPSLILSEQTPSFWRALRRRWTTASVRTSSPRGASGSATSCTAARATTTSASSRWSGRAQVSGSDRKGKNEDESDLRFFMLAGLTVAGPKCYYSLERKPDGGTAVSEVKFKGSSSAKHLPDDVLKAVGDRTALLRERTPRIMRSAFGVG